MKINQRAKRIHQSNIKKGFWDKKRNEGEVLFLIITELAEVCEADRKSRQCEPSALEWIGNYRKIKGLHNKITFFEAQIKDTIGDELADAFIRMCDYCIGFKIRINEREIGLYSKDFSRIKIKNLGEELLKVSGHINFLSEGVVREITASIIFAKLIWISQQLNLNLEKHIEYKMWYNSTRPKMHNKKY